MNIFGVPQREKNDTSFLARIDDLSLQTGINLQDYADFKPLVLEFLSLIEKYFSEEDQQRIFGALLHMMYLHADQKRKHNYIPYFTHPIEAAIFLIQELHVRDRELVEAILLHDTIEDQSVKIVQGALFAQFGKEIADPDFSKRHWEIIRKMAVERIAEMYSAQVANIVLSVSNPNFEALAEQEKIKKTKFSHFKNKIYLNHIEEILCDSKSRLIKIADFCTNARLVVNLPPEFLQRKQKLAEKYIPIIPLVQAYMNNGFLDVPSLTRQKLVQELQDTKKEFKKLLKKKK